MNRRAPGAAVRVTPGTAAGLHMSKGKPHSRAVINQATGTNDHSADNAGAVASENPIAST